MKIIVIIFEFGVQLTYSEWYIALTNWTTSQIEIAVNVYLKQKYADSHRRNANKIMHTS